MVSYNYCPYICELYQEFYIFRVVRPNSMSQTAGSEYEEVIITNYDPRKACWQLSLESLLNCGSEARYELILSRKDRSKRQIKGGYHMKFINYTNDGRVLFSTRP